MSLWGRIFAAMYDRAMDGTERAGLADQRRELLAAARGEVLELGAGTGLNLSHYGPAVSGLVLTEPEEPMARRLERRLRAGSRRARVLRIAAESLPFEDSCFDTVVCTLVLCTVSDRARTLSEVARVLRPGGQLLFLEHVRSERASLAGWQDRLAPLWRRVGHGCRCNSNTLALIEASPLTVVRSESGSLPKAIPLIRPTVVGAAELEG
ncbi:MAG: class I SAM-dependent methyltransferase [Solirubrobacteraceae bacterium]